MENTIECSICMEEFLNPRVIPCGHSYCSNPRKCLSQMLRLNTPPECAVCKHKLPRDLKEENVPRNFALSAAIDAMQAGPSTERKKTDSDVCPEHNKTRKFFCRPCSSFLCKKCWEKNHMDTKAHEVVPFSSISENYAAAEEKLTSYRQVVCQLSDSIAEVSEKSLVLRDIAENTKDAVKLICEASGPTVLDAQVNSLKQSLEKSHAILTDMSNRATAGIETAIKQANSALQDALSFLEGTAMKKKRTIGEGKLKETIIPYIIKGNVVSRKTAAIQKAAVDEKGNVICLYESQYWSDIECFKVTEGQLSFVSSFKWKVKKRKSFLCDIAIVSNKFIGVLWSQDTETNSLHLIEQSTFESIQKLHLQDLDVYEERFWRIAGYDEALAVFVAHEKILLFRGPQFRFVSCVEVPYRMYHSVLLCSMDTVLVNGRGKNKLCIVNFNRDGSSFKRFITIDAIKYFLRDLVFIPYPKPDNLQGFLSTGVLDENNDWISDLYFLDLKSVQDGDIIQPINNDSIWTTKFKQSLRIVCARGPGVIVCQDNFEIFNKQQMNERKVDFTTLTFR